MVRQTNLSVREGVESYPLTPMQQGMLYHHVAHGVRGVDVEQVVAELHEPIDAIRLEQAWREVLARHAALRAGFEWEGRDEPRQVIYPASCVKLRLRHAEFGSDREARRGLEEYLAADRREAFTTSRPPLLRVALLRGGPAHFWFVTTYHHLLLDARSMTILFREVLELHDALACGETPDLPPVVQFRSHVEWLQQCDPAAAEAFWREHLRGFRSPTLLAHARADTPPDEHPGAAGEIAFRLPEAETAALRELAKTQGVTLNTIVQAAWSLVLSRHSGEDDVVFGAVRAGRSAPIEGLRSTIGLFINTVPVRARVAANSPIGRWLAELRRQWVALREHEHTALVQIRQWSDVPASQPLFDTLVSFQEPAWDDALKALGGPWAKRSFEVRAQPNYPLALEALAGATLTIKFVHDPVALKADRVGRLAAHVRTVLEALASGRCDTVGELPVLTRAEEIELLVTRNRTGMEYPRETCVHTLVEMQARRAPDAPAVCDASTRVSFAELNARADQLAHRLRRSGVGAESLVAVCMDRSVGMIVAWLAVLKAGGAFVPFDTAVPDARLTFQLEDCGARVLLVGQGSRRKFATAADVTVVEVARDGTAFTSESGTNPPLDVTSRNLAYVIYTSGSTGQPKGVGIEHRSLMNLVAWHQRTYAVTPADRATQLASPAFDAAVWEIWPYLTAGASVHIPPDETRISPPALWSWLHGQRITLAFLPTPLAEAMMGEPWPAGLRLRAILTGGDKLRRRPPANFPCALVNHYGPTESTVVATAGSVAADGSAAAPIAIGRPIANTQAYVLDPHRRLVPMGATGELYLGGESLARGYHHRPELTAEKFVSNPLPGTSGPWLYRTGDLVRWTPAGELEFVGRLDHQVKIRGCRIELGEIEAALQQHPATRECVVQAQSDERGELHLVAYVLVREAAPPAEDFLAHLRTRLPAYMIPALVVPLASWPLTLNGKVDREALTRLASAMPGPARANPLLTGAEETIARIWTDVLRCRNVAADDNFFDLGGHSLLAAQAVSRVNAALRSAVSVRVLFDHPTLRAFAAEVERRRGVGATPPPRRVGRRMPRTEMVLTS